MAVVAIFFTFLLFACLLVLWFGGTIERAFTAFLVASAALTLYLSATIGMLEAQHALFAIDLAILAVALTVMHRSSAHWPIWFAGFHAIIVATELAHLLVPSAVPGHYINAASFWALPEVLVLVLGTLTDHRMRVTASRPREVCN